jgi:hypothetical protein
MRLSWTYVFAFFLGTACFATGQFSGAIPDALKPSLQARLSLYTQAQAEGRWDTVATMLGRRRGGSGSAPVYTPAHKACLISYMQNFPLISFTMTGAGFSTEILNEPMSKRWWTISGDAVYKTDLGEKKSKTLFIAYRDEGQWYFTPPNFDNLWHETHQTDAERTADYADEITIQRSPTCPIEFSDLHAYLDKQYSTLLHITFKLRNRSRKKVTWYTLRLYTDRGAQTSTAPNEIDVGTSRDEKMESSRYTYFCAGARQENLIVDEVNFADGSQWRLPGLKNSNKLP